MSAPSVRVTVNGLEIEVDVDTHLIDEILLPRLAALAERAAGERQFVFLAAPPGAGKSTLAAVLERRATSLDLATIGLDGFHLPTAHLAATPSPDGTGSLLDVKGAPETFDVAELRRHLRTARHTDMLWPTYDRTLHDVVPASKEIAAGLVLVEGNWLLLDEPGWGDLSAHSSLNIFVSADRALLRERLIDRKVRGGMDRAAATDFFERSDGPNVDRVLRNTDTRKVDLMLHLDPDGTIDLGGAR
ncbi:MAG: nucleoside/nucleotide kinase family protein [Actinotalea sp.]|nr:nucleoside/nucleotide kinase family protein [Actinotalea sp.]